MPVDTADLLDLSTEDFHALVEESLRYKPDTALLAAGDPEELRKQKTFAQLQTAEVIERYYYTLVAISKRVESTLGSRRAQLRKDRNRILAEEGEAGVRQAEQTYSSFRSSTLRFKGGLDQALADAKHLLQKHRTVDYEHLETRIRELEGAIMRHRHDLESDMNQVATEYDLELWKVLDG